MTFAVEGDRASGRAIRSAVLRRTGWCGRAGRLSRTPILRGRRGSQRGCHLAPPRGRQAAVLGCAALGSMSGGTRQHRVPCTRLGLAASQLSPTCSSLRRQAPRRRATAGATPVPGGAPGWPASVFRSGSSAAPEAEEAGVVAASACHRTRQSGCVGPVARPRIAANSSTTSTGSGFQTGPSALQSGVAPHLRRS